jgi:hypothetical protein
MELLFHILAIKVLIQPVRCGVDVVAYSGKATHLLFINE